MRLIAPSDRRWFWLVALGWFAVFAVATWSNLMPAERWFKVEITHVLDTVEGEQPQMLVLREIRRPFRAEWIATVQRRQEAGGFAVYCVARGESDYRPGNVLPDQLSLAWWTYPTRCDLPVGSYRIHTLWTIHPPGYPPKEVRITSNEFRVLPRE